MTLVHPCVRPSFRPSDLTSVRNLVLATTPSSFGLKFCRFVSYNMKMCVCVCVFSAIFDRVIALADADLVPATSVTSFVELI